jgi:hypothetical protein
MPPVVNSFVLCALSFALPRLGPVELSTTPWLLIPSEALKLRKFNVIQYEAII